jgi:PAS domain S-box-containing protein
MFKALERHIRNLDRLEDEWSISYEKFERTFYDSPIAMALVAFDGVFIDVNQAACEIWGKDRRTLLESKWQDLTHPDDINDDAALTGQVLIGQQRVGTILKRYLRGDQYFPALLSYSIAKDNDGRAMFFISQILDLSQAQKWIDEAKEKFGDVGGQ